MRLLGVRRRFDDDVDDVDNDDDDDDVDDDDDSAALSFVSSHFHLLVA